MLENVDEGGGGMWLIPKKTLELNVDGSPGVPEVFITSRFPLPSETHTTLFISLLAELLDQSIRVLPFPNENHFASHQASKPSNEAWIAKCRGAGKHQPQETTPTPPNQKKKTQKTTAVTGGVPGAALMRTVSCSRPLQLIFFHPFSQGRWISFCSPRWADMQSVTHSLSIHALVLWGHGTSHPHLITFRKLCTPVQIGRLTYRVSARRHAQRPPWLRYPPSSRTCKEIRRL